MRDRGRGGKVADVPAPRPKDAATLLIVRRDGDRPPQVLMGRRSARHAFMPGKWVFPGGRVHPSDFRVPAATELRPEVAAGLERGALPGRSRALALAAIRETFEETGLLIARAAPPRSSRGEWRDFLRAGLPDLGALDYVARAVTPPGRTRRFDARFFVADARALLSLEPGAGSGELGEIAWFDWDAAAALDLPQITRAVLAEVALREVDRKRPIPFHNFERGSHRLLEA